MHARSDILCLIDDGTSSFLLTTLQWAINHSEVTLEFLAYLRSYHKFPYTTFKSIQNRKSRKYVSCEIAIAYYFKCYFINTLTLL